MRHSTQQLVRTGKLTAAAVCLGVVLLWAPLRASAELATLTDDTYSKAGSSATNGKKTSIVVGVSPSVQDAFVQFDLSTLPAGAVVEKATLTLFVKSVKSTGPSATFDVIEVTSGWDEATLSGTVFPVMGSSVATTDPLPVGQKNEFLAIEVSHTVEPAHECGRRVDRAVLARVF
jgi:hypothetical protein